MKSSLVTAVLLAAMLALVGCAPAPLQRTQGGRHPPCLTNLPTPQHAPSTIGMAFIRGGAFQMGAKPMRPEEGPPRLTRVGSFWIDRTDVTNAEFARFVAATGYVTLAEKPLDPKAYPGLSPDQLKPSAIVFVGSDRPAGSDPSEWWRVEPGADWRHPKGPGSSIEGQETLPVVQIAWDDAVAYARWLGRDLPTEAEWEYAAQGGKGATRFVWGDAPIDPAHPQANVWQGVFPALDTGADGFKAEASPVGCFPANGYGLYDMAGDVWQWTMDWYRANLYPGGDDRLRGLSPAGAIDPGDPGARKHVIKGGSFLCSPDYCYRYRPAAREAGPTDTGENHIGFRTVLRIEGGQVNRASSLPRSHDHSTMPAKPLNREPSMIRPFVLSIAVLSVALASSAAFAQPAEPTPREACRSSALSLCPSEAVARDRPAVQACLIKNWDKVAPDCKSAIKAAHDRAAKP